jgi:ATP-binding cassette subfamily B protein
MTTSTETGSTSKTAVAATPSPDTGTSRELKKGSLAAFKGLMPFLTPYRKAVFPGRHRPGGGRRLHHCHPPPSSR